jgi:hypothetical protein
MRIAVEAMAVAVVAGLLTMLAPAVPLAASLYRCTGANGEIAFTSSKSGYRNCRAVQVPQPPALSQPDAQPGRHEGPSSPRLEFRSAPAGAEPSVPTATAAPDRTTRGAVYRYVKDGVTHYTNRRPVGVRASVVFTYIESCFACAVRPGLDFHSVALNREAFAEEIEAAATRHGVDPALVRAIVHAESAFDPNALSNKGAQGLMQLMPATAERFGVSDAFTPAQNIDGGTRYLAWLLKRFDGDSRLAAAGYNAGEGSVDRYGGVPPFEETQRFVERVAILRSRYGAAAGPASAASTVSAGAN